MSYDQEGSFGLASGDESRFCLVSESRETANPNALRVHVVCDTSGGRG